MTDTIVALSTPPGMGALGIIRLSGDQSIAIADSLLKGKNLTGAASHTVHFGVLKDKVGKLIDEVVVTIFRSPTSFTKEDTVEISCHGSNYILQTVLKLCVDSGARLAEPGEYTQRAFLNGRFDLTQAEAVGDLIASESEAAHRTAMQQMRGGFSKEIQQLRERLIHFASMIELELDFSEEDVEFADRKELLDLVERILKVVKSLIASFELGNVMKNGIPIVIAGKPNVGKSTLLNALLNEEKAIVSDIPGTTRDVIEDTLNINGILFRFVDTAGLRETDDVVEAMGVDKTKKKMQQASLIIYLIDLENAVEYELKKEINKLKAQQTPFLLVGNKEDLPLHPVRTFLKDQNALFISAKEKTNLDVLRSRLLEVSRSKDLKTEGTVVTNIRHYQSLKATKCALDNVVEGVHNKITHDFLAIDIRQSLHHLGEITGEVTTDELLGNIFSNFCIGK